eukprot:GHVU01181747.1.p1 GENE.GHVU01181747.1~~GHVU01181747.1.p1  ORF type:complete len:405 (-),score=30.29 GHVU01181747.1:524-1738(-)
MNRNSTFSLIVLVSCFWTKHAASKWPPKFNRVSRTVWHRMVFGESLDKETRVVRTNKSLDAFVERVKSENGVTSPHAPESLMATASDIVFSTSLGALRSFLEPGLQLDIQGLRYNGKLRYAILRGGEVCLQAGLHEYAKLELYQRVKEKKAGDQVSVSLWSRRHVQCPCVANDAKTILRFNCYIDDASNPSFLQTTRIVDSSGVDPVQSSSFVEDSPKDSLAFDKLSSVFGKKTFGGPSVKAEDGTSVVGPGRSVQPAGGKSIVPGVGMAPPSFGAPPPGDWSPDLAAAPGGAPAFTPPASTPPAFATPVIQPAGLPPGFGPPMALPGAGIPFAPQNPFLPAPFPGQTGNTQIPSPVFIPELNIDAIKFEKGDGGFKKTGMSECSAMEFDTAFYFMEKILENLL